MLLTQIKDIRLNFILTGPRTGSTLLFMMFNAHPNILSTSEEPFVYNLHKKYQHIKKWDSEIINSFCYDFYLFTEGYLEFQFTTFNRFVSLLESYKDDLNFDLAIRLTYLSFIPQKNKDKVLAIVDKQLKMHDFMDYVALVNPASKFIVLWRNPLDAVPKRKNLVEKEKNSSDSIYYQALNWNYEYSMISKKKKLIGNDRFLDIKYEDLIQDTENQLKKICAFLDLPFNIEMLNYNKLFTDKDIAQLNERLQYFLTNVHKGIRDGIDKSKVGESIIKMSNTDREIIASVCGKTALLNGYTDSVFNEHRKYFNVFIYAKFLINKVFIPSVYYKMPFYFKYIIKKIKYSRRFKTGIYTSDDFYKRVT